MEKMQKPPRVRDKINRYTAGPIIALSSYVFMAQVPFLPDTQGAPILRLIIALALGVWAVYRQPRIASWILAILVSVSVSWQLIGFGMIPVGKPPNATLTLLVVIFFIANLMSARLEPVSMALAVLAVALMLTPQYYLSIALIVAAVAIGGLSSILAISITFIATILPLLIVDNSIYYFSVKYPADQLPIIFSQLEFVDKYIRPPLPGLNIFATGLPDNFVFPLSSMALERFLNVPLPSGRHLVSYMIVPLILFGVFFMASGALSGMVNSLLNRLSIFERTIRIIKIISPLATSVITPLTFVFLMTSLSGKTGGYETSLARGPTVSLSVVLGSLLLGGVFMLREFLTQRLERPEKELDSLRYLTERTMTWIKKNHEYIEKIKVGAPTVNAGTEEKMLEEDASYVRDIERGVETAGYTSLLRWNEDLQKRVLPHLEKLPENLRLKLVNELNLFATLTNTYNAMLAESGVSKKFNELEVYKSEITLEGGLNIYKMITSNIRDTSASLFELYVSTSNSFMVIMEQPFLSPPIDPRYLLDYNDYSTGMKLIAEEYWMNFHIKNGQEMENKIKSLTSSLIHLGEMLDPTARSKVEKIVMAIANSKPADSQTVLQKMKESIDLIGGVVDLMLGEVERLGKLVNTLTPGITRVIHFEVIDQLGKLRDIQKQLSVTKPSLAEITNITKVTSEMLKDHREVKSADENNLMMISQYPAAKIMIESLLKNRNKIPLEELPFQFGAATVFAKLYAFSNSSVRYDDDKEELVVRNG